MALLSSFSVSSTTLHQLQCASGKMASAAAPPISRLCVKPIDGSVGPSNAARFCYAHPSKSRSSVIVKVDGTGGDAAPEGEKAAVPVENLSLESKLEEKMIARLRMKLAKKMRLRRKRLVRKRKLRKKGRWPPSKMKKLKNV